MNITTQTKQIKTAVKAQGAKIKTLREHLNELQKSGETQSQKLDALQGKVDQVIKILKESIPSALQELPEEGAAPSL